MSTSCLLLLSSGVTDCADELEEEPLLLDELEEEPLLLDDEEELELEEELSLEADDEDCVCVAAL